MKVLSSTTIIFVIGMLFIPASNSSGADSNNAGSGNCISMPESKPKKGASHDSSHDMKLFMFTTDLNPSPRHSTFKESFVDLKVNAPASGDVYSFSYCFRFELSTLNYQCLFYEGHPDIKFNFPEPQRNYGFVHVHGHSYIYKLPNNLSFLPRVWYHVCVSHDMNKTSKKMTLNAYFNGANVINEMIDKNETDPFIFPTTWRLGFCKKYLTEQKVQNPLSTIFRGGISDFNMWSIALSDAQMTGFTQSCSRPGISGFPAADIIDWESACVAAKGANAEQESASWICADHAQSTLIFKPNIVHEEAMLWCEQLGGSIPLLKNTNEISTTAEFLKVGINRTRAQQCEHFWMPIMQREESTGDKGRSTAKEAGGQSDSGHDRKRRSVTAETVSESSSTSKSYIWTEYYKNKDISVPFAPWDDGQPDGMEFQACVTLDISSKGYHDKSCAAVSQCSYCDFSGPSHFYLRGLPNMGPLRLDTEYVFVPHGTMVGADHISIAGYIDQFIEYDNKQRTWKIISGLKGSLARLRGFGSVSPFGRKTWIYDKPNGGKQAELELKLTKV